MQAAPEKRSHPRHARRQPAKILIGASEIPAYTKNISQGGFFLEFQEEIDCGVVLDVVLLMPTDIIGGLQEKWFHCHALVKRVEADPEKHSFGVAAQITSLQLLTDTTV
jgi:hypothetical protein